MMKMLTNNGAYMVAQGQKLPLQGDYGNSFKLTANPIAEVALLNNKDLKFSGIEDFNGKEAYVVKFATKTLFFDSKTGLKLGENTTISMMGQEMELKDVFGEYQDYSGIKFPKTIDREMGPGGALTFTVSTVKLNEGVTDADFEQLEIYISLKGAPKGAPFFVEKQKE